MRGRPVSELAPGDLIAWETERFDWSPVCVPMRVVSVREVPEADRVPRDRASRRPPYYLEITDLRDGKVNDHYRVDGNTSFVVLGAHHPLCVDCGQVWPCKDELIDKQVERNRAQLDAQCAVCHKSGGYRMADVRVETPDGVAVQRFHTRKGTPCRTAYLRAVAKDPEALAAVRREDAVYAVPQKTPKPARRR